jgi:hypothetical protein
VPVEIVAQPPLQSTRFSIILAMLRGITPMTFTEALIAAGYVYDEDNYDGCYVKQDADNFIHVYQQGENDNEWNYVKMTEDFDVISEVTFDPDSNFIV